MDLECARSQPSMRCLCSRDAKLSKVKCCTLKGQSRPANKRHNGTSILLLELLRPGDSFFFGAMWNLLPWRG